MIVMDDSLVDHHSDDDSLMGDEADDEVQKVGSILFFKFMWWITFI